VKEKAFIGASLFAAVAASLCCILPIIFALTGAGIMGASAFFEACRPALLTVTFILLGLGFYFAYRTPKVCAPGSACQRPGLNRKSRLWLWIVAILVLLFASFPYYSGLVAKLLLSDSSGFPSQTQKSTLVTAVNVYDCKWPLTDMKSI
jgi:mercuric ion transport protein